MGQGGRGVMGGGPQNKNDRLEIVRQLVGIYFEPGAILGSIRC